MKASREPQASRRRDISKATFAPPPPSSGKGKAFFFINFIFFRLAFPVNIVYNLLKVIM